MTQQIKHSLSLGIQNASSKLLVLLHWNELTFSLTSVAHQGRPLLFKSVLLSKEQLV